MDDKTREQMIERLQELQQEENYIRRLLEEIDTAKWRAFMRKPGTVNREHIGTYDTEYEAAFAVEQALEATPEYQGQWERQGNHWFIPVRWQEGSFANIDAINTKGQPVRRMWA